MRKKCKWESAVLEAFLNYRYVDFMICGEGSCFVNI